MHLQRARWHCIAPYCSAINHIISGWHSPGMSFSFGNDCKFKWHSVHPVFDQNHISHESSQLCATVCHNGADIRNIVASLIEFLNQHMVEAFDPMWMWHKHTSAERCRKFTVTMKNYKLTYYKLYEISELINDNFGWIIVSLMMQNANNAVQPFYWVIVELHEDDIPSNLRILSKYILNPNKWH